MVLHILNQHLRKCPNVFNCRVVITHGSTEYRNNTTDTHKKDKSCKCKLDAGLNDG